MKSYFYILLLFIYSGCGWEESGPLDYEDLVVEGWKNFMNKDYDKAEEFFSDILAINPDLSFPEAYMH